MRSGPGAVTAAPGPVVVGERSVPVGAPAREKGSHDAHLRSRGGPRPSRSGWPAGWPRARHREGAGAHRRGPCAGRAGSAGRGDLPDDRRDPDPDAGPPAAPALRRRRPVQALARDRGRDGGGGRPHGPACRSHRARGGGPGLGAGQHRVQVRGPPHSARPGRSRSAGRPSRTDAALGVVPLRPRRVRLRVRHFGGPQPPPAAAPLLVLASAVGYSRVHTGGTTRATSSSAR